MFKEYLFDFDDEENALIITLRGEIVKGFTHEEEDVHANADAIVELMGKMVKDPQVKEGVWMWVISEDWTAISGEQLEDEYNKWELIEE